MSSSSSLSPDKIIITDLSLPVTISLDHWSRSLPSPHSLSLSITHPIETSASTDTLPDTINYSTATKAVTAHVQSKAWASLEEAAESVVGVLKGLGAGRVGVKIGATKVLAGGWVEVQIWRGGKAEEGERDSIRIREIPVRCVIGINPQERLEKQMVVVDLEAPLPPFVPSSSDDSTSTSTGFPHKLLSDAVHDFVTPSSYQTIESITSNLATHLLSLSLPKTYPHSSISSLTVRVSKPYALTFARYASVEITRSPSSVASSSSLALGGSASSNEHVAILALGSNIGDSVANVTKAVEMINTESEGTSRLIGTSFLYQSEPMYVEDQAKFVNGACKITTTLSPLLLLRLLKKIEAAVGRTKTFTNGPRVVDLDLIFYDDESVRLDSEEGGLIVPHPRLAEREFVLRPLADIIPTYQHPSLPSSISTLLSLLPPPSSLIPILPFHQPSTPLPTTPSLLIMSILNLTPDSFSDGGSFPTTHSLVQAAQNMINEGANILDVGGLSTRPGADEVSEEEETRRVVEGIRALREAGIAVPISVDTYRAGVAREALKAGANCVNDVRAGLEAGMLEAMAQASVPVVLMHSRGTPKTMGSLTDYSSSSDASTGIVDSVRLSLLSSVQAAISAGVKKWNIVLDPGLGFAKTSSQNLELLAHLDELTKDGSGLEGYPVLVGGSRKRFVGEITGVEMPRERVAGSLGVVAACYVGGGERRVTKVVRVHDTKETRELIGVLEAVGRGRV
ncbi:Dihydropteroate synthase-like protein [Mrakia frigida]|uniref:trifunctional dihydropteroate synthetase/dihydrohydroxymethylpterin pyrophosphokinase/dihydroneopterin aldolase FOL1 n=1 Tax=Mrakia frigida TaxID=29902 RepID=UPI003FCBEFE5